MKLLNNLLRLFTEPEPEKSTDKKELAWQHAKEALQNTQSVIQFVDTKSSILMGLIIAATGALASAPFWILGLSEENSIRLFEMISSRPCTSELIVIFWVGALFFGIVSLICVLLSIIARPKNHYKPVAEDKRKKSPVLLFPLRDKDQDSEFKNLVKLLPSGITHEQILREYGQQLDTLGAILNNKIQYHRRGVFCLITHVILGATFIILVGFLIFG